jgi:hypothetical protein
MEAVILGVMGLLAGALVTGYGARVFYVLLPLWGFVTGVMLGAEAVSALVGDGFLATTASWAAGLVLGIVLAVTAILWLWAAVLVLAFGVGSAIGSGLLLAIGLDPGILPFAAGIAVGAALVVLALALDAPLLLVATLSALGGAALVITAALLILGRFELADLAGGPVGALRGQPLLVAGWLALAALGLLHQLLDTAGGNVGLRTRLVHSLA